MPPSPERVRQAIERRVALQRLLVRSLLKQREQLGGSLFVRYAECGKESCACRRGQRHGPYYVFSTRSAGTGGFAYLEAPQFRRARSLVERYREFRAGLKRLQKVNVELVTLLRRYQESMVARGSRHLGLANPNPARELGAGD